MISFAMPYYRNPGMLAHQFETWAAYPEQLKAAIEIVLVDDGSPEPDHAMSVPRPEGLPSLRIYRVLEDIPWHQHGAKNLAAKEALGPWLFLTDMDHLMPADSLQRLFGRIEAAAIDDVFMFHRVDAPDGKPTRNDRGELKPHCNTFAMSKAHYWTVGGYDEDCVGYGTDGYFRRRLLPESRVTHLADVPVVRYPREVIADASTRPNVPMDPKAFRHAGRRRQETDRRLAAKQGGRPRVLDFEWERVL